MQVKEQSMCAAMLQPLWFLALAVPLALYLIFLLLLTIPCFQRIALYANNFSTSWIDNLDAPEAWGFAKNQVTPFYVETHDGYKLHAWHILPRALYARHEAKLSNEIVNRDTQFESTLAYRLLAEDRKSKLILKFHGNAGHLLQHHRPAIYRSFTSIDENVHLIVFSYRGFGRSSGNPSEAGLITDGITMVDYAMKKLGISPADIALVGQSLGTAVVSGVAEFYCTNQPPQVDLQIPEAIKRQKVDFATIVLIAAFSDLKTMLLKYSIAGYFPVLTPVAWIPGVPSLLRKIIWEPWDSKGRIGRIVREAFIDVANGKSRSVNLQFMHALDDRDIPYENSKRLYEAALDAANLEVEMSTHVRASGVENEGAYRRQVEHLGVKVSIRLPKHGGHNDICSGTDVAVAVMHGFGLVHGTLDADINNCTL